MQRQDKEYIHGLLGVEVAKIRGIFQDDVQDWSILDEHEITLAAEDMDTKLQGWRTQLEESSLLTDNPDPLSNLENYSSEARVLPISDLWQSPTDNVKMDIDARDQGGKDQMHDSIEQMNEDQCRAYDIIDWHLSETISGKKPPQLLMVIPGEGGVGKTKLIQTITQNFHRQKANNSLVKGVYTGIAASLIDGKTLHVLAGIPVRGGKQSAQTLRKLREFWRTKRYLIIDEISMLSCIFFLRN